MACIETRAYTNYIRRRYSCNKCTKRKTTYESDTLLQDIKYKDICDIMSIKKILKR